MTFTAYCQKLAPQYGVHYLTVAKRIRAEKIPAPPMHRENKRAFYVADGVSNETIPDLKATIAAYRIALADSIRRPMGVVPDSAQGLITIEELTDAEQRRTNAPALPTASTAAPNT